MLDSYEQAKTVSNVVSVFRSASIKSRYDEENKMLMPYVDKSAATKVRHRNLEKDQSV